jgi:mRNA deadenylase 3'-5' endonuclease subunit Ccr4
MVVVGKENSAKLNIDNLNKIIIEDLKDRVLVSSYFEYERLMQGYIYLDPATSNFVVHASAFCSFLTGKYRDIRIDSMSEFYSVMKHLGFRVRNTEVDGFKCSLLYVRSRFLFKNESDWKEYMLDVSKDTLWEENFRAFLLGEDVEQEDIPSEIKEEIMDSATVFLDTEKNIR